MLIVILGSVSNIGVVVISHIVSFVLSSWILCTLETVIAMLPCLEAAKSITRKVMEVSTR